MAVDVIQFGMNHINFCIPYSSRIAAQVELYYQIVKKFSTAVDVVQFEMNHANLCVIVLRYSLFFYDFYSNLW